MKRAIGFLLLVCVANACISQHILKVIVKDARSNELLAGASVQLARTEPGKITDSTGTVRFNNVRDNSLNIHFRFVSYREKSEIIPLPQPGDSIVIFLEPEEDELGEVVITSTRSTRTIRNIPTRVEFLSTDELEEKGNMRPGDIRMMLNESTGIQTQQISATSANSSIRIQGLDGRYTQILKDGFPLYGGFSGGLGLLQTPPLDLKQVEIIKGSTSTLYGGGAIAGMVNLISKSPKPARELQFLINLTSAGGLDLNSFYSEQYKKVGLTLYAGYSANKAYDPSNIGFSAIPKFNRFSFNPKLFFTLSQNTNLSLVLNLGFENRIGGDMEWLAGHGDSLHSYYEQNKSRRISMQMNISHKLTEKTGISFRNSISSFQRNITIPGYTFDGSQLSSYSELDFNFQTEKSEWVTGLNVYTDDFKEFPTDSFPKRNYAQNTLGLFLQNTWTLNNWLQTEAGLRGDYVFDYGFAFLPRVSALFKITPKFTSRLGVGLG